MAIPREDDDERLKRAARYLQGFPHYVQWHPVQENTNTIVLFTDADWATCLETRRSNSGGTLHLEDHLIAARSRIQPRIALSSVRVRQCCMLACGMFRKHWGLFI